MWCAIATPLGVMANVCVSVTRFPWGELHVTVTTGKSGRGGCMVKKLLKADLRQEGKHH